MSREGSFDMRNCVVASMSILAAMLLCTNGAFGQSAQQPVTAKADANSTAFDPRDFSGVWNPAPRMQPKGEVDPLDLGGHPNP